MRDHEIELISALVEGRLEDESEARALIASSAELQAAYEAQKNAREALTAAGPALMRQDEKTALHRDLWTELRTETKRTRTPWYYRWVPITAGLFIVMIAVVVVGGGGGNETAETLGAIGAGLETAPTTTAAATASTDASATEEMAADGGESAPEQTTARDLNQLDTQLFAKAAATFREGGANAALTTPSSSERSIDLDECLGKADLADVDVIGTIDSAALSEVSGISVPDDISKTFVVAVPAGQEVGTASFIFFVDSESCQTVYVDE
jgi:hypothetical protein